MAHISAPTCECRGVNVARLYDTRFVLYVNAALSHNATTATTMTTTAMVLVTERLRRGRRSVVNFYVGVGKPARFTDIFSAELLTLTSALALAVASASVSRPLIPFKPAASSPVPFILANYKCLLQRVGYNGQPAGE